MDEFELIDRYFLPLGAAADSVVLGIGDDAAVVELAAGDELVVTTDTQVESVHFPAGADAGLIGFRACAASLSDIAAMGAEARWATLALTCPRADAGWLNAFTRGAAEALADAGTVLIGGDTTRGPLVISWTILGSVPSGQAIRRDGGRAGDQIYVSGTLGGSRAALDLLDKPQVADPDQRAILACYWRPQARLVLGRGLRGVASSCIDVSDGLLADVAHIARRSGCGAEIEFAELPYLPALTSVMAVSEAREFAANGGEDFELCFTVPRHAESALRRIADTCGIAVTRIGRLTNDGGVRVVDEARLPVDIQSSGYRHFD